LPNESKTMQLSSLLLLALLYSLCVATANAKVVMKVVFDDATISNGYFCSDADLMIIDDKIGDFDRRKLFSDAIRMNQNSVTHDEEVVSSNVPIKSRELLREKCYDLCRGWKRGTCLVTGCSGFRRQLRLLPGKESRDRYLKLVCSKKAQEFDNILTKLVSHVSNGCKMVLQAKREITCDDLANYAAIESFSLWDGTTDTILRTNLQNGDSICSNVSINIEAIPNACVEKASLQLKGPISVKSKQKTTGPYYLFGNSGGDIFGQTLPVGLYTLTTELPDTDVPPATLTFSVKTC
jgi:hypothetical protein